MSSESGDEDSWESSSYDSDEHDSDDFVYDSSSSDSSSSDYLEEVDIPNVYDPVGVESDDDEDEYCHWSTNQNRNSSIRVQRTVPQIGKPAKVYPDGYRPCDLVNDVINNEFLDRIILCTNAHGRMM